MEDDQEIDHDAAAEHFIRLMEEKQGTELILQRAATPLPANTGLSYIGGLPRLPPGMSWPTVARRPEDGPGTGPIRPTFLAQIDMADPPRWTGRRVFPETGTIYVFCNTQFTSVGDPQCRVLFHPASSANFPECEPPSDLMRIGGCFDGIKRPWFADNDTRAGVEFRYPLSFSTQMPPFLAGAEPEAWRQRTKYLRVPAHLTDRLDVMTHDWPFAPVFYQTLRDGLIDLIVRARLNYDREPWARHSEAMALAQSLPDVPDGDPFRPLEEEERARLRTALLDFMPELERLAEETSDHLRHAESEVERLMADALMFCVARGFAEGRFDGRTNEGRFQSGMDRAAHFARSREEDVYDMPHQMLGVGADVQNAPEDHVEDHLLLQFSGVDCCLGWSYPGSVLQLWITPADLAARNFDNVVATMECE